MFRGGLITVGLMAAMCSPFTSAPSSDAGAIEPASDAGAPSEDAIGAGDGHEGAMTIAQSTVLNRYYELVEAVATGANKVGLTSTPEGLVAGDVVLLWQPVGLSQSLVSNAVTLSLSPADGAGRYELARVDAVDGNTVTIARPTAQAYPQTAQLVRVPQLAALTIASGGAVEGTGWNGKIGGIVALLVQGTIVLEGTIRTQAAGLRGGLGNVERHSLFGCTKADSPRVPGYAGKGESIDPRAAQAGPASGANGGGGGACHNAGGGGGGHGGAGGRGGRSFEFDVPGGSRDAPAGRGGASMSYEPTTRLLMGGGGGAGDSNDGEAPPHGGDGGGVIFVRAGSVRGGGTFEASGDKGTSNGPSGAGGGGGGGLVFVTATSITCGGARANGGVGGDVDSSTKDGPGGGGGGGVVWLKAASKECTSLVAAGAAGALNKNVDWGQTAGAAGRVIP